MIASILALQSKCAVALCVVHKSPFTLCRLCYPNLYHDTPSLYLQTLGMIPPVWALRNKGAIGLCMVPNVPSMLCQLRAMTTLGFGVHEVLGVK